MAECPSDLRDINDIRDEFLFSFGLCDFEEQRFNSFHPHGYRIGLFHVLLGGLGSFQPGVPDGP